MIATGKTFAKIIAMAAVRVKASQADTEKRGPRSSVVPQR
jgi:hypothetical protein